MIQSRLAPLYKSGGVVTAVANAETVLLEFDVAGGEEALLDTVRINALDAVAEEFVRISVRVNGTDLPDLSRLAAWRRDVPITVTGKVISGGRKVQVVAINTSVVVGDDVRMVATCEGSFRQFSSSPR